MSWYDAAYGDDPEAGNVFGREDRRERRNPVLHAWLASGGSLADFARLTAEAKARDRLKRIIAASLSPRHFPACPSARHQNSAAAQSGPAAASP